MTECVWLTYSSYVTSSYNSSCLNTYVHINTYE